MPFTISATGETGLFSRSIVRVSRTRCSNPSCSGIRGERSPAPTATVRAVRSGRRRHAFLDELASTSPAFQASLLRVLQSGEVRRVGSTQTRRVNVRIIGASNPPLRAWWPPAVSAPTCITGSASSASSCPPARARRRCGTARQSLSSKIRRFDEVALAPDQRGDGRPAGLRFSRECARARECFASRGGTRLKRPGDRRLPSHRKLQMPASCPAGFAAQTND